MNFLLETQLVLLHYLKKNNNAEQILVSLTNWLVSFLTKNVQLEKKGVIYPWYAPIKIVGPWAHGIIKLAFINALKYFLRL